MSFAYQGYTINTYKDEPWYDNEIGLFQDIIAKIGAKGVAHVTAHRHNLLSSSDGAPNPALWVDDDGDINVHSGYSAGLLSLNGAGVIESGSADADDIDYTNSSYSSWASVKDALDELSYVAISVASIQNDAEGTQKSTSTLEEGQTLTSVTVQWGLNKSAVSLELTDVASGDIVPGDTSYEFTSISISSDKTWTLQVTDSDGGTDSASTSLQFKRKMHWGNYSGSTIDSAGILSLSNNSFATVFDKSFYASPSGQYIWFAYPASFGDVNSVKLNGVVNDFTKTTVSHTNASGDTVDYYAYRSPNNMTADNILVDVD